VWSLLQLLTTMSTFDEDPRPGYVTGSKTSRMAAEDHRPRRILVAWQVLEAVRERSGKDHIPRGMTANEACNLFRDRSLNTVSARFTDLSQANCLLLTGKQRPTDKGSKAEVYVANPNATQEFLQGWLKERARLEKLFKPAKATHEDARRAYADACIDQTSADIDALLSDLIQSALVLRRVEREYDDFLLTQGCPGGIPDPDAPNKPPPFMEDEAAVKARQNPDPDPDTDPDPGEVGFDEI